MVEGEGGGRFFSVCSLLGFVQIDTLVKIVQQSKQFNFSGTHVGFRSVISVGRSI